MIYQVAVVSLSMCIGLFFGWAYRPRRSLRCCAAHGGWCLITQAEPPYFCCNKCPERNPRTPINTSRDPFGGTPQ